MAIVVQCYHCQAILELDEGFRGGVCRCSQCGSLLQVPKSPTAEGRKARPAAPGASVTDVSKRPGTPLDDPGLSRGQFDPRSPQGRRPGGPGEAGISSGAFSRSRPAAPAAARRIERVEPAPGEPAHRAGGRRWNTALVFAATAAVVVICLALVGVIGWYLLGSLSDGRKKAGEGGAGGTVESVKTVQGPSFFGVPLTGKRIVFSVDAASSAQDSFSYVIKGLEQAIGTLGDDQEFRVAFWTGEGLRVVPGTAWATKASAKSVRGELESAAALGSSDAEKAMTDSLKLEGDQVIFVTAKYGLTEDLGKTVLGARVGKPRIDAIKIGPRTGSAETESPLYPLRQIAGQSGGEFMRADVGMLEEFLSKK